MVTIWWARYCCFNPTKASFFSTGIEYKQANKIAPKITTEKKTNTEPKCSCEDFFHSRCRLCGSNPFLHVGFSQVMSFLLYSLTSPKTQFIDVFLGGCWTWKWSQNFCSFVLSISHFCMSFGWSNFPNVLDIVIFGQYHQMAKYRTEYMVKKSQTLPRV